MIKHTFTRKFVEQTFQKRSSYLINPFILYCHKKHVKISLEIIHLTKKESELCSVLKIWDKGDTYDYKTILQCIRRSFTVTYINLSVF